MELIHRDGLARIARFSTGHGIIETPAVMPVVNPNIVVISPNEMRKLGANSIITNSYIIRRTEKLREAAEKNGIHSLMNFDGPIMTDSGTFQSYVYGNIEYNNVEIVDFQRKIGSDIATILDIFSRPSDSHAEAEAAVDETYRRMNEIADHEGSMLAGTIQGSIYPDLRVKSARLMGSSKATYLPIGGVVPLLESYNYTRLVDIIIDSKVNSSFDKPIHLFGGGHPMFMGMSVLLGVDMFDSASYIKYARNSRLLFPDGTRDLVSMSVFPYWSPLNGKYTVQELIGAPEEEKVKAIAGHNLTAIFMEVSEIRERIFEQTLWQYVESKARSHPFLFNAFRRILERSRELAKYEELYKKSPFFYFDSYSDSHPVLERIRRFSENTQPEGRTEEIAGETWKPGRMDGNFISNVYNRTDHRIMIRWENMSVPIELNETFPVEQVISASRGQYSDFRSEGRKTDAQNASEKEDAMESSSRNFDLQKIRTVADLQFSIGIGTKLFPDNVRIIKSRNTGRIRNIMTPENRIIATMRAHDGFLTLNVEGGKILRDISPFPSFRVQVDNESAAFNSKGFNVFFKFIKTWDPDIVPLNETLIVDGNDNFVAVGRATVSGAEMGQYRSGVAVKVHHSISGKDGSGS
ncbi:MAG: tRNA-guanine(15) transglycosylase [Thermoplasmatales archaeon B_DKE]|nr:MAG: tRNA-guanine(15) transglycosylase [Thermoplasmatales archaeon B_DKE]QRF75180.1 tRNA-guanine(15) transglycosylase [Thermoplasmatales archaeon]